MPIGSLRWFQYTGIKGLYVVEYRYPGSNFEVFVKFRGFWERKLLGQCTSVFGTWSEANGRVFTPSSDTIPAVDTEALVRGVRQGWHQAPSPDFFGFRFPLP